MKKKSLFLRLVVLLATMISALGINAQEPYAVYTSDNTTLTFYYDNDRSSRTGTTYDLNEGGVEPAWVTDFTNANVKQVVFDPSFEAARPTITKHWFYEMKKLESITGLEYLNTNEVTRMDFMFYHCYKLTSLNLEKFNISKVTDMSEMFRGCSALQTILVGNGWRLSDEALIASRNVFKDCNSLVGDKGTAYDAAHVDADYARIDGGTDNPGYLTRGTHAYVCYSPENTTLTFYYDCLRTTRQGTTYDLNEGESQPGWYADENNADVTQVVFDPTFTDVRPTTTYAWFANMQNLENIEGIEYLNTSEVTTMAWMFANCKDLTDIGVSHFNTAKVTTMNNMFGNCWGLTSVDLSSFSTSEVANMNKMFFNCKNLRTIYVSDGWNTDAVTDSERMFEVCDKLVGGKGSKFDENVIDKTYARIDGGTGSPGYLSDIAPAPYACYTVDNTTLTFYYDNLRSPRQGAAYDLNQGDDEPGWYADGYSTQVTHVVFAPSFADARPTTTFLWFYCMNQMESITGLEYLNTSEVTSMAGMFSSCRNLASIDLSNFNTEKVTNMSSMFADCQNLASIDASGFKTEKVTNMSGMFTNCLNLTSIDVSGFNTSEVTNMSLMFSYCTSLTSLDLSSFNTSKVTDMRWMFSTNSQLTSIRVGSGWTTDAVTASTEMFLDCTHLEGGWGTTYDDDHIEAEYARNDGGPSSPGYLTDPNAPMAYACYTADNTTLTFYYDNQRKSREGTIYYLSVDKLPVWVDDDTYTLVTHVAFDPSFAEARPTDNGNWFFGMQNLESITGLEHLNTSEVTRMDWMFYNCTKLTTVDLSTFNTEKVSNMLYMFSGCSGLTTLDLSSFNTASVTRMDDMFNDCINLQTIYVSDGWTTDAVTESMNMFRNCEKLVGGKGTLFNSWYHDKTYAHIDGGENNPGYLSSYILKPYACYTAENTTLTFYYDAERGIREGTTYSLNTDNGDTEWDTDGTNASVTRVVFDSSFAEARPTSTYGWFYKMQNLQTIEGIEHLNTSEVTRMDYMFFNCQQLSNIEVKGFNTAKVTSMLSMFAGCAGLTTLDLTLFKTSKVTSMEYMFNRCANLTTIYVGDWNTRAVTLSTGMFNECYSLKGGLGTTYDANHVDAAYAHNDGGASNPGYFSMHDKESYVCRSSDDTTLTFYHDVYRRYRTETTYDIDGGENPEWRGFTFVTKVVFDPSFAEARPTSTHSWFLNLLGLQTIKGIEHLNTSEVTDMAYMFDGCISLTSIDLSHFNTDKVNYMNGMFSDCQGLTNLDLSVFNTGNVKYMEQMFYECSELQTIYVGSGWNTDAVVRQNNMFYNCEKLVGGQGTVYDDAHVDKAYAHVDGGPSYPGYFTKGKEAYACYTADNTTLTFYYDFNRNSRTGTTYDLKEGENTPGWRDKNDGTYTHVTRVVFDPSFAIARPTTTWCWFDEMHNLESIIGLNYVNSHDVAFMGYMFYECSKLTSLDLSSFNTSKVTKARSLFEGCSNLRTIYVGDGWTTAYLQPGCHFDMFKGCVNLVGGQGTTYDENHVDGVYAHIDGGPSYPGYFTAKPAFIRGDVNDDSKVTIADVTALVNIILGKDTAPATGVADVNEDGKVTIADVTALVNIILNRPQ